MLKIKENVPLEELGKYGFIIFENDLLKEYRHITKLCVSICVKQPSLRMAFGMNCYEDRQVYIGVDGGEYDVEDILYDLINVGFIEKKHKLKIKEDIPLEWLEKYGFYREDDVYINDSGLTVIIDPEYENFGVAFGRPPRTERELYFSLEDSDSGYDVLLYDLIQAGLIERSNVNKIIKKEDFKYSEIRDVYYATSRGVRDNINVNLLELDDKKIGYANTLIKEYEKNINKIIDFIIENRKVLDGFGKVLTREKLIMELNEPTFKIKNNNECEILYTNHTFDDEHYISINCQGVFDELKCMYVDGMVNKEDFTFDDPFNCYRAMNSDGILISTLKVEDDIVDYANTLIREYEININKIVNFIFKHNDIIDIIGTEISKEDLKEALEYPEFSMKSNNHCIIIYSEHTLNIKQSLSIECRGNYLVLENLVLGRMLYENDFTYCDDTEDYLAISDYFSVRIPNLDDNKKIDYANTLIKEYKKNIDRIEDVVFNSINFQKYFGKELTKQDLKEVLDDASIEITGTSSCIITYSISIDKHTLYIKIICNGKYENLEYKSQFAI